MNKNGKLSKRDIEDLLTMIRHTRADISYNEGGSYNDMEDNVDDKDVAASKRAIEIIKKIILVP
jgi:hypothetical protein